MMYRGRAEDHFSRREIDMAIGALIGLTHCSPERAFDVLADAVHQTGAGLGAVSAALLALAGDDLPAANSEAVAYWQRTLDRPA